MEVQTGARHLTLDRSLDEQIDTVPLSLDPGRAEEPEGLWVVGSELRLHQVLTNLATNAVKYTPEGGGSIRISTEFLGISTRDELPGIPPDIEQEKTTDTRVASSEARSGQRSHSPPLTRNGSGNVTTQCLNFRLVVHDSGPGIKPSDLVEDRLFQPFVQVPSTLPRYPWTRGVDTVFRQLSGSLVDQVRQLGVCFPWILTCL